MQNIESRDNILKDIERDRYKIDKINKKNNIIFYF